MIKRLITGLPCVGGKSKLADRLCDIIEDVCGNNGIRSYISACGGRGKDILSLTSVLFDELIYNEIDPDICRLMAGLATPINVINIRYILHDIIDRVLQIDIDIPDELCKKNSKDETRQMILLVALFDYAKEQVHKECDTIKAAALSAIIVYGSVQNNRMGFYYDGFKHNLCEDNIMERLVTVAEKDQNVEVRSESCFDLIAGKKYDPKTFIYVDPPYYNCTNGYENDWILKEHREFVELCRDAEASIMICTHKNGILPYLALADDPRWHCYKTGTIIHSSRKSSGDRLNAWHERMNNPKEGDKPVGPLVKYTAERLLDTMSNVDEVLREDGTPDVSQRDKYVDEYAWCNFETDLPEKHFTVNDFQPTEFVYDEDVTIYPSDWTIKDYYDYMVEEAECMGAEEDSDQKSSSSKPNRKKNELHELKQALKAEVIEQIRPYWEQLTSDCAD